MGSFNEFKKIPEGGKLSRPEALMAYEKIYMDLLRRYKDEIHEIEEMMRTVRDERLCFYEERLPAIRKEMEKDEVLSEIANQWLAELQANVEKSFRISEELIGHYVTKNLKEFEAILQQEIRAV